MQIAVLTIDVQSNQEVAVYLEAGSKGIKAKLPSFSAIRLAYENWQKYANLATIQSRLEPEEETIHVPTDTSNSGQILEDKINDWLNSRNFQDIRDKIIAFLGASEKSPSRIIIKTDDLFLQQIPWYCWDILKEFNNTEITLSFKTGTIESNSKFPQKSRIKLLAILGSSKNISIESDIKILKEIESKTKIKVDIFPNKDQIYTRNDLRESLFEILYRHEYDIIFFAGHGVGTSNNQTNIIRLEHKTIFSDINISDLENALTVAVTKGLRLAIFNSCFGMKLGQALIREYGLTTIVMREKIRDDVAILFLKNFLNYFYSGKPLCLAVKEARQLLPQISDTWLPVIFQNESADSIKLRDWILPNISELLSSISLTGFNVGLIAISFAGTLLNHNFWLIILFISGLLSAILFALYPYLSKKRYLLIILTYTLFISIIFIFYRGIWLWILAFIPSLISLFGISLFCFVYSLYHPLSKTISFLRRFIYNAKQTIR